MRHALTVLFVLAATLLPTASATAAEQQTTLVPFVLKDQFGTSYTSEEFVGKTFVILAADGAASGFTDAWGAELARAAQRHGLEGQIEIVGLADLRAVPSFVRSQVRGGFPTKAGSEVLLDWKGVFARSYDFAKRNCNMLLFDANGRLLFQAAGREVEAETIARFESILTSHL